MKTLYVHIPFCRKKCFYCSFVVAVGSEHKMGIYLDALDKEARRYKGERVRSVYIGGGTPSLLENDELKRLFALIRENFYIPSRVEWTMEANPEGLDRPKLDLLKNEGVNRISLGVQSLQDKYLDYLGRNHNAITARESFKRLRMFGFDNINVDLMFAFPRQTMNEVRKDVEDVLRLQSDHLSLYTLTVEERSRFYARNIQLEDGQYQAEQYSVVCEMLKKEGFEQYEVSNFAKPSKASEHNLNYWQGGMYVGLGVGAHSYIDGERFWNVSTLNEYLSLMRENGSAKQGFEMLTPYDQMKDIVLFGLRMNRGVDVRKAEKRFGCSLSEGMEKKVEHFVEGGFLSWEGGCLKATDKGRLLLDELCAQLV